MFKRIVTGCLFPLFWIVVQFLVLPIPAEAQEINAQQVYYYHNGEQVSLTVNPEKTYVLFDSDVTQGDLNSSLRSSDAEVTEFNEVDSLSGLELNDTLSRQEWAIIDKHDQSDMSLSSLAEGSVPEHVLYEAPFLFTPDAEEVGLSHLFYVKLKKEADLEELQRLADENQVTILGHNKFMPLWYTLACSSESSGNALEVANIFFESGFFAAAEPDFLVEFEPGSANDTFFDQQWGLENTGQNDGTIGVDINASDAWTLTTGSERVFVAVLDHGIELDHPDMPNVAPFSFDTVTGSGPSQIRGNHGTACAGIIGAARNNNEGIAGVAPDIRLMSISDRLRLGPNASQELADGLNWAWQTGADIISNSWGHNGLASPLIDDAIDAALTQGRAGLGTVVIFISHNDNGAVRYPGNSNPNILTVGAISPCGERKSPTSCDGENWGSNFGPSLDVMAPGVLIPTTDRQGTNGYDDTSDYTLTFNGTSSAAPHVAGVAALTLSANPALTQQEVVDIIERTAQKVGDYNYQTTADRDNGTWNNEMGYGLVDAYAAIKAAPIAGCDFVTDDFEPDFDSSQWSIIANGMSNNNFGGSNALFFNGDNARLATTRRVNVANGGNISFRLIFGDDANGGENADAGEDVALEYSINNGSSWTEISRYDTEAFTTWTQITESIPAAAQSSGTLFRWRQINHSNNNFDNWGLDDVLITCPCDIAADDFDPVVDSIQWTDISNGVVNTNFAETGSLFFTGSNNRFATTRGINVANGGTISFRLIFGDDANGGENADAGEDVVLEYSTSSGEIWTEINRYDTEAFTAWTQITESIPAVAQSSGTLFRWRQISHSNNSFDNWGLDNVLITCPGNQTFNAPRRRNQFNTSLRIWTSTINGNQFCQEEGFDRMAAYSTGCGEDESSYVDYTDGNWNSRSSGSKNQCYDIFSSVTCAP